MQSKIDVICQYIFNKIKNNIAHKIPYIIAIDGNCGAGKSTIAHNLSLMLSCDVVHMDDFYLPFELRTEEQMKKIGGNIDFDRLISQVLLPFSCGKAFEYKAYNCQTGSYSDSVFITPKNVLIVEGAYSCHPELSEFYDFKVFLSLPFEEQMRRIIKRNGEAKALEFKEKWIVRENHYFDTYDIKNKCDIIYDI